jgi:hypothetical protein
LPGFRWVVATRIAITGFCDCGQATRAAPI